MTGGPLLWVATMSLRTTPEIFENPYAFPSPAHWDKFVDAWTELELRHLFPGTADRRRRAPSPLVTLIGAMAAHCLARYRFAATGSCASTILTGMILPPQLVILSLFQILLDIRPLQHADSG